jgi:hypothetical protein
VEFLLSGRRTIKLTGLGWVGQGVDRENGLDGSRRTIKLIVFCGGELDAVSCRIFCLTPNLLVGSGSSVTV